jgi:hypothetical protein
MVKELLEFLFNQIIEHSNVGISIRNSNSISSFYLTTKPPEEILEF